MMSQESLAKLPEYTGTGTRLNNKDWSAVFANLTPHMLRIQSNDGEGGLPASFFRPAMDWNTGEQLLARVEETLEPAPGFNAIPAPVLKLGVVKGLPPPSKFYHGAPGLEWIPVYFIVSRPCAMALLAAGERRPDVLVAGEPIRDGKGIQYAAVGFHRLWPETSEPVSG